MRDFLGKMREIHQNAGFPARLRDGWHLCKWHIDRSIYIYRAYSRFLQRSRMKRRVDINCSLSWLGWTILAVFTSATTCLTSLVMSGHQTEILIPARQFVMYWWHWWIRSNISELNDVGMTIISAYCITRIFRVEEIFAIFANLDFARNKYPLRMEFREIFFPRMFSPREN